MKVSFKNYSMLRKEDGETYDWCVFVSSPRETVEQIQSVEYTLHPSFREPHRISTSVETRFALLSSGWGEFDLGVVVTFHDGSDSALDYRLRLQEKSWPTPKSPAFPKGSPEAAMLALLEDDSKYRWRRIGTLARKAELNEKQARALLRELAEQGVCREAGFTALDGQPMWGACSVIGVMPSLEQGG